MKELVTPDQIAWDFSNNEYHGLCATDEPTPEYALLYDPDNHTIGLYARHNAGWSKQAEANKLNHDPYDDIEHFIECIRDGACARHDWTIRSTNKQNTTVNIWDPIEGTIEQFTFKNNTIA